MKVLVADDTKNIRTLLTKCLELEGCSVEVASDGKTALELIAQERFDLAFIDIKMPLLSGTEVLKRIREMGIDMPVIIITAYASVKNAVFCTNMGAVAYLQKPFTADKIKSVLSNIRCKLSSPNKIESILSQAKVKIFNEEYSEAEKLLKSTLSEYSLNPEVNRLLSETSHKLGNNINAEKYYKIYELLRQDYQ